MAPFLVGPAEYGPASTEQTGKAPDGVAERLVVQPQGFQIVSGALREQIYRVDGPPLGAETGPFVFAPLGSYFPGDLSGTSGEVS